jgi:hypothetical protein
LKRSEVREKLEKPAENIQPAQARRDSRFNLAQAEPGRAPTVNAAQPDAGGHLLCRAEVSWQSRTFAEAEPETPVTHGFDPFRKAS